MFDEYTKIVYQSDPIGNEEIVEFQKRKIKQLENSINCDKI